MSYKGSRFQNAKSILAEKFKNYDRDSIIEEYNNENRDPDEYLILMPPGCVKNDKLVESSLCEYLVKSSISRYNYELEQIYLEIVLPSCEDSIDWIVIDHVSALSNDSLTEVKKMLESYGYTQYIPDNIEFAGQQVSIDHNDIGLQFD